MEITERSATDLARAIRDGELTSRAVVEAHIERARRLNPALKAIAADRFEAALAEADAADGGAQACRRGAAAAGESGEAGPPANPAKPGPSARIRSRHSSACHARSRNRS